MTDKYAKGGAIAAGIGAFIQALPPDATTSKFATAGATAVRVDISNIPSPVLRIAAANAIYLKFGDNTVTASAAAGSLLHPAGAETYIVPKDATDVSIIQVSTGGAVTITGMGDP